MSVLIKDMVMPETCEDCPFNYDEMSCIITGTRWWVLLEDFDYTKERLHDCPLSEVLSVQQERKKGKWVPLICTSDGKHHEWCGHQCSICGERTLRLTQHNFCPNCGADMRGEQDG